MVLNPFRSIIRAFSSPKTNDQGNESDEGDHDDDLGEFDTPHPVSDTMNVEHDEEEKKRDATGEKMEDGNKDRNDDVEIEMDTAGGLEKQIPKNQNLMEVDTVETSRNDEKLHSSEPIAENSNAALLEKEKVPLLHMHLRDGKVTGCIDPSNYTSAKHEGSEGTAGSKPVEANHLQQDSGEEVLGENITQAPQLEEQEPVADVVAELTTEGDAPVDDREPKNLATEEARKQESTKPPNSSGPTKMKRTIASPSTKVTSSYRLRSRETTDKVTERTGSAEGVSRRTTTVKTPRRQRRTTTESVRTNSAVVDTLSRSTPEYGDGLENTTVAHLREKCRDLGLSTKGRKKELVQRVLSNTGNKHHYEGEVVQHIFETEKDKIPEPNGSGPNANEESPALPAYALKDAELENNRIKRIMASVRDGRRGILTDAEFDYCETVMTKLLGNKKATFNTNEASKALPNMPLEELVPPKPLQEVLVASPPSIGGRKRPRTEEEGVNSPRSEDGAPPAAKRTKVADPGRSRLDRAIEPKAVRAFSTPIDVIRTLNRKSARRIPTRGRQMRRDPLSGSAFALPPEERTTRPLFPARPAFRLQRRSTGGKTLIQNIRQLSAMEKRQNIPRSELSKKIINRMHLVHRSNETSIADGRKRPRSPLHYTHSLSSLKRLRTTVDEGAYGGAPQPSSVRLQGRTPRKAVPSARKRIRINTSSDEQVHRYKPLEDSKPGTSSGEKPAFDQGKRLGITPSPFHGRKNDTGREDIDVRDVEPRFMGQPGSGKRASFADGLFRSSEPLAKSRAGYEETPVSAFFKPRITPRVPEIPDKTQSSVGYSAYRHAGETNGALPKKTRLGAGNDISPSQGRGSWKPRRVVGSVTPLASGFDEEGGEVNREVEQTGAWKKPRTPAKVSLSNTTERVQDIGSPRVQDESNTKNVVYDDQISPLEDVTPVALSSFRDSAGSDGTQGEEAGNRGEKSFSFDIPPPQSKSKDVEQRELLNQHQRGSEQQRLATPSLSLATEKPDAEETSDIVVTDQEKSTEDVDSHRKASKVARARDGPQSGDGTTGQRILSEEEEKEDGVGEEKEGDEIAETPQKGQFSDLHSNVLGKQRRISSDAEPVAKAARPETSSSIMNQADVRSAFEPQSDLGSSKPLETEALKFSFDNKFTNAEGGEQNGDLDDSAKTKWPSTATASAAGGALKAAATMSSQNLSPNVAEDHLTSTGAHPSLSNVEEPENSASNSTSIFGKPVSLDFGTGGGKEGIPSKEKHNANLDLDVSHLDSKAISGVPSGSEDIADERNSTIPASLPIASTPFTFGASATDSDASKQDKLVGSKPNGGDFTFGGSDGTKVGTQVSLFGDTEKSAFGVKGDAAQKPADTTDAKSIFGSVSGSRSAPFSASPPSKSMNGNFPSFPVAESKGTGLIFGASDKNTNVSLGTTPIFGSSSGALSNKDVDKDSFGVGNAFKFTDSSSNIFGKKAQPAATFGATSASGIFGSTPFSGGFAATSKHGAGSSFGAPSTFDSTSGQGASSQANTFGGSSTFGATPGFSFGSTSGSQFAPAASTPGFGAPNTASSPSFTFGNSTSSASAFGGSSFGSGVFGAATSSSAFGGNASPPAGFNIQQNSSASMFGAATPSTGFEQQSAGFGSSFGTTPSVGGFGTSGTSFGSFGGSSNAGSGFSLGASSGPTKTRRRILRGKRSLRR